MQKDALNNVHIADEQVLITPEELKSSTRWTMCWKARSPLHAG